MSSSYILYIYTIAIYCTHTTVCSSCFSQESCALCSQGIQYCSQPSPSRPSQQQHHPRCILHCLTQHLPVGQHYPSIHVPNQCMQSSHCWVPCWWYTPLQVARRGCSMRAQQLSAGTARPQVQQLPSDGPRVARSRPHAGCQSRRPASCPLLPAPACVPMHVNACQPVPPTAPPADSCGSVQRVHCPVTAGPLQVMPSGSTRGAAAAARAASSVASALHGLPPSAMLTCSCVVTKERTGETTACRRRAASLACETCLLLRRELGWTAGPADR